MKEFLTTGCIDVLRPGLTRDEVIALYGPPPNWDGKDAVAGPIFTDPEDSRLWLYHNGAIGLGFTQSFKVGVIFIYVYRLKMRLPFMAEWPPINTWSVADLVRWIERNNIEIESTDWDDVSAKILVNNRCVVWPNFDSVLLDIKTIEEKRIGIIEFLNSSAGPRLKSLDWMTAIEMV